MTPFTISSQSRYSTILFSYGDDESAVKFLSDRRNDPLLIDSLWRDIQEQARVVSLGDIYSSSIMMTSILSQPRFEDAVISCVSNTIATPLLQATQISSIFQSAIDKTPELPTYWALDILSSIHRDSSSPNAVSVLLFSKGFHSLVAYRLAHHLWVSGRTELAR